MLDTGERIGGEILAHPERNAIRLRESTQDWLDTMPERVAQAICESIWRGLYGESLAKGVINEEMLGQYVKSDWRNYVEAARAAIPAALEWQPIRTAPKDGSFVLLHGARGQRAIGQFIDHGINYGTWQDQRLIRLGWAPTYWMPQPPPPAD